jgi:hypothetical protein
MIVEAGPPGLDLAAGLAAGSVLSRHTGQSPAGASSGSGVLHIGQIRIVFTASFSF